MKARYKRRFHPTDQQQKSLAQLFGCVRVVWNGALALSKASKFPGYNSLAKTLTLSKKTVEREWLNDVSSVPLQQFVKQLETAYKNYFDSLKGKRKGKKLGQPKFKKKSSAQSATFTKASFSIKGDVRKQKQLARQAKGSKRREKTRLQIAKLHNQISDKRSDFLHKLSSKVVSENQAIVLEDLNVSGMVTNRKLARVISLQGWRQFRALVEAKSEKFGRKFVVINRWEPTSQVCSDCGFNWGKIDLSVRSILCLNCGTEQDRDLNASRTIEMVGIGHCHDLKRTGSDSRTTSVASCYEPSKITVA